MRFTQRSKPAGALQAPLAGVYVHVTPPSFEYLMAAVMPAGSVTPALATLNCTKLGIESTIARLDALAVPVFVSVDVKVRSVPGAGEPPGLTAFPIVITGRITVTTNVSRAILTELPNDRPLRKIVSFVPTATFPTRYVTVTATVAVVASAPRRALSGFAPCVMVVPVIETTVSAVPGLFVVSRS